MDTLDFQHIPASDADLVVQKLMEYYGYYRRKYARSTTRDDEAVWFTVKKKLESKIMYGHLIGGYAIGTYAGECATKFISIDVDEGDRATVQRVINTMVDMGIPRDRIYVSFSGKKGYHVDIFFKDKVMNNIAYQFYVLLIDKSGLNPRKVEFRPTNKQAIKVPLGVHQATGRRCWFVDPITLGEIRDFSYVLGIQPIEEKFFNDLVARHGKEYMAKMYAEAKEIKKTNHSVIQAEDSYTVTAPGQRHNLQVKVAVLARCMGCSRGGVFRSQMEWFDKQDKTLTTTPRDEVETDANQIADWVVTHIEAGKPLHDKDSKAPEAVIKREMIPYIVDGKNETERLVSFIIWVQSLRYGSVKMAYRTIADKVGRTVSCVTTAVKNLMARKSIIKCSTDHITSSGFMMRESNRYTIPKRYLRNVPDGPEEYVVTEWLTPETTRDVYYRMVTAMCPMEYLEKFLKKPELEKCRKYLDGSVSADD